MAHLTANGITLPGAGDTFEEVPDYVGGETGRGISGRYLETRTTRKRTWTCRSIFLTPSVGEAIRKLVDGDGHSWLFDEHTYSGKGLGPKSGGSYTRSGTGGKHGGKVAVDSGSYIEFALASRMGIEDGWDPTQGWTLIVWKEVSGTYTHYIATGAVAVTRGASSDPPGVTQYENGVAGSHAMGEWVDVASDGDVGVHGYDAAGAAGAFDYDGLVVLPFELPAAWAPMIYAFHDASAWPRTPQLTLDGDALEDGPVTVHGRSPRIAQRNVVLSGTAYNNARVLDLSFFER